MSRRAVSRAVLAPLLIQRQLLRKPLAARPANPTRILIAHHLLLGDTLMLTPLLARLRERYPKAELWMTVPTAFAPLYVTRPYGVQAHAYDPRDVRTLLAWLGRGPFDIAFLPADNRFSAFARAVGARWIVGFAGDTPGYKNWLVDEQRPFASAPMAFGDLVAQLVDDAPPLPYRPTDWPTPPYAPFDAPREPYCVLHVGASNRLRQWPAEHWRALAAQLGAGGLEIVLSAGAGEGDIVRAIDPAGAHRNLAGRLTLPQLWGLLARADLLVTLDTGIAHLGRLSDVPTVVLFGPGSPAVFGAGEFWRNSRYRALQVEDLPCRAGQDVIFRRRIPGMAHCIRLYGECTDNICMQRLPVDAVLAAARAILKPRNI